MLALYTVYTLSAVPVSILIKFVKNQGFYLSPYEVAFNSDIRQNGYNFCRFLLCECIMWQYKLIILINLIICKTKLTKNYISVRRAMHTGAKCVSILGGHHF